VQQRSGVCWNHLFESVPKDLFVKGSCRPDGKMYAHRLRGTVVIPAVEITWWLRSHQVEWVVHAGEGRHGSRPTVFGITLDFMQVIRSCHHHCSSANFPSWRVIRHCVVEEYHSPMDTMSCRTQARCDSADDEHREKDRAADPRGTKGRSPLAVPRY
jgi:hypothetical protein